MALTEDFYSTDAKNFMDNVKEFVEISDNMTEIKELTAMPCGDRMSENEEFHQFPNQNLDIGDSEDNDEYLSNKRQLNIAVSTKESKHALNIGSSATDDLTNAESDRQAENSLAEEVESDVISAELFSDVDSSVSHDPKFMANQNEELKNRDVQKWIRSVEQSSAFAENCEQMMEGNQQIELPIPKRDHQERIAIETQTDWEWVMCAVANQSLKEKEREEMVEEDESEESGEQDSSDDDDDDERLLSFNSTKSSELISSSTPPSVREVATPPCLPNVGPPKILQYCRESEKDIVNIKENKVSIVLTKNSMGLCEFCENPTKPLPTLEQESTQCPEELYCCEEYQKFLEMVLQNETEEARLRLEIEKSTKECLKSGKSLPKAKILNKKELKNKVKAREMKLKQKQESFQQQQQQQQQQQIPPQGYHTSCNKIPNFLVDNIHFFCPQSARVLYTEARQMNTINYQLSSRRCLEEGWTVRTPYLEQLDFDGDIFEVEPGKRIALWRGAENIWRGALEKFYDTGHKFFTIFADGTGNIFYPSGCLAVLITATQLCHFTYVIYHEATVKRRVAAIFEHTGYGTCYHANGNVRLYIDPSGGVEADEGGVIKRRWHWHQPGSHVHAPPLQPIHIALNKFIGIKLVSQRNIQLNFIAKRRSCKINMGVNVKPVNVLKSTSVVDENHFYLEDKKANIECLLSKVRNLIQYGHSPKLQRILPPIYLTNKTSKLQQQAKQLTLTKKRPKTT